MSQELLSTLDFGNGLRTDASLSDRARGLQGSEILKIAAEIREIVAAGRAVCNLTVGDFNAKYFPIPQGLRPGSRPRSRPGTPTIRRRTACWTLREAWPRASSSGSWG